MHWHNYPHAFHRQFLIETRYRKLWPPLVRTAPQHGLKVSLDSRENLGFRLEEPQHVGVDFFDRARHLSEHSGPIGLGRAAVGSPEKADADSRVVDLLEVWLGTVAG